MKIFYESLADTEDFLQSSSLISGVLDLVSNGVSDSEEITDFVIDQFVEDLSEREEDVSEAEFPQKTEVMVLSVDGDTYDVVSPSHYVIEFNNLLYDYTALNFAKAFGIRRSDIPVIQPVISSRKVITQNVSTVKHYALLLRSTEDYQGLSTGETQEEDIDEVDVSEFIPLEISTSSKEVEGTAV